MVSLMDERLNGRPIEKATHRGGCDLLDVVVGVIVRSRLAVPKAVSTRSQSHANAHIYKQALEQQLPNFGNLQVHGVEQAFRPAVKLAF
jgi:hypothetical protein